MHAFLFSGNIDEARKYANSLGPTIEFDVKSVSEAKKTQSQLLVSKGKYVAFLPNLDLSSNESKQVLLKSIEEPLPGVTIVVHVINKEALPETILSRLSTVNQKIEIEDAKLGLSGMFSKLEKIKDRTETLEVLSRALTSRELAPYSDKIMDAIVAIKKNGNTTLQILNLKIRLNQKLSV
jgi:DNA polymerase III gamma/tau subunit